MIDLITKLIIINIWKTRISEWKLKSIGENDFLRQLTEKSNRLIVVGAKYDELDLRWTYQHIVDDTIERME